MEEKRREARHRIAIAARLLVGKKAIEAVTRNVSFKGVSLKADEAPPLRQLVRIELTVPESGAIFSSHATVVHVADGGEVGLEFFGVSKDQENKWDGLVRYAQAHPAPIAPEQDRRRSSRAPVQLELRVRTNRSIHVAYSMNISREGILMAGGDDFELVMGEPVTLNVVHPGSRASIRLTATVKRRADVPPHKMFAVELDPLAEPLASAWEEFLASATPPAGGQ